MLPYHYSRLKCAMRLLVAPAVAAVVAIPFGLGHVEYATGILQAGMPAAILVSIIAIEHDVVPGFVTTTVFFSTLLSLLTLTVLLTLILFIRTDYSCVCPGLTPLSGPSAPSPRLIFERQARLAATGGEDTLVLRSDPYKT